MSLRHCKLRERQAVVREEIFATHITNNGFVFRCKTNKSQTVQMKKKKIAKENKEKRTFND